MPKMAIRYSHTVNDLATIEAMHGRRELGGVENIV
jgi:hypothetical protein